MPEQIHLTAAADSIRLDKYLADKLPKLSRSQIKDLITTNNILVNNKAAKAAYQIHIGDQIKVNVLEPKPLSLPAQAIPLEIVYEDPDVIVVNKPQGMVVHPAAGHPDHTLVNALLFHTKQLAKAPENFRPGIVHRIDKDTSGLLMVAKNAQARVSLEHQLAQKTNKRQYLAIVHGNFTEASGRIDAPIGRDPKNRKKMAVVATGKKAITHFTVLEQFKDYSLIQCQLETGRTHQIRVHLAYIGHPVAGDPLYGPKKTLPGNGQFLHAETLGFEQPTTGKWLEFSAPVPAIFEETLTKLRSK